MELKSLADLVIAGQSTWQHLKQSWRQLNLPGSPYAVSDFLAQLFLSRLSGSPEEIAQQIREGAVKLAQLKRDPALANSLTGNTAPAILLLALLDSTNGEVPKDLSATHGRQREPFPAPDEVASRQPAASVAEPGIELGAQAPGDGSPIEEGQRSSGCDHVDSEGRCLECTNEESEDCSGCGETCILAKLVRCKNPDCEDNNAYCRDCDVDNLSEAGYCPACQTVECDEDGCGEEIARGQEKHCANPDCLDKLDYCEDSASKLLNTNGLCVECSGEELLECDGCNRYFTSSRLIKCGTADCERHFCQACSGDYLENGLCERCRHKEDVPTPLVVEESQPQMSLPRSAPRHHFLWWQW